MYRVQLSSFEGPLDLLLQLIAKAKIDIKDIFVSEITEQYLAIVQEMDEIDMETASEFLSMAATLLYIKSRSLLPKQVVEPDVEEEKQRLIQNLYEYRRIKQAADAMLRLEEGAAQSYYKLPDEYMHTENEVILEGLSLNDLFSGFMDILKEKQLQKEAQQPVDFIRKKYTPVVERVAHIRSMVTARGRVLFRELFTMDSTKDEVIASFLALLELISSGEVKAVQDQPFGDIVIGMLNP
ncbi:MAG: segregation/condensation protein A [Clostridiales bacterium]|nr:segregation/condensation protein A [Clostridiales bacterium]